MPASKDLMEGFRTLDEYAEKYRALWTNYSEDLPEHFASQRIKDMIENSASAYRVRLTRVPVNAIVNRLGISSIVSSRGDAVNRRIEEIRQANDMELQEGFVTERLAVFGDAYLLVYPVEPDELDTSRDGEAIDVTADEDTRQVGIELAYQSPVSCRAFYDAEDGRRHRFTIRRWTEKTAEGKVWRAEVWYADRLESWITQPDAKGTDETEWLKYTEDAFGNYVPADETNWPEPHDFGECPIKHARSDLPYGRSVIADFSGPQNLITKAIATQSAGIEANGWKERYRLEDEKALESARDSVNWGDDKYAPPATRAPRSGRRSGPGTEQVFKNTKAVGEFSAPDLGAFIDPMEHWVLLGAAATGTPLGEFDPRFGAQMSGVAWDRAEKPMRAKERHFKRFLLRFWREVYGLALGMTGIDGGDITINWEPPEVISDPAWWEVATIRRQHGVPQRAILMQANYTDEEVDRWEQEQDEALLVDARIDRLMRLGEALNTLGAGASLIGIPPERIAKLIEDILGDAGSPGKLQLEEKEVPPQLDPNNQDQNDEEEEANE